jgi:hypothetical protein
VRFARALSFVATPGPLPTLPRKRERESVVPRGYSPRAIGAVHFALWDRLLRGALACRYSTWAPEAFTTAAHFGTSLLM